MAKRLPVIFLMLVIILSDVMAVDSFEPLSVEFTVDDARTKLKRLYPIVEF